MVTTTEVALHTWTNKAEANLLRDELRGLQVQALYVFYTCNRIESLFLIDTRGSVLGLIC